MSELDGLNDKMAKTKSEVDKGTIELVLKEQELMKIEDELNEKGVILNKRIASIYKNRATNILEILLKAEDFIEFISRLKAYESAGFPGCDNSKGNQRQENSKLKY